MLRINILGEVTEYKGYYILVQNIADHFQYIIFHEGKFYQAYSQITKDEGDYTDEEFKSAYAMLVDQAIATCELMIHKNDPQSLIDEHEGSKAILDILEDANSKAGSKLMEVTEGHADS